MPNKSVLSVEGISLQLSNLDKVLYPLEGFTKSQVIDYYIRVAPFLLPHLSNRPLTMKRYPGGAAGDFFYQKECPSSRPSTVDTVPIWSSAKEKNTNYCLVSDLPALIWLANLASLELHTSLSRTDDLACPTMLVFDLDPGEPATVLHCAQVALLLKAILHQHELASFPKTSGSKGLQIYVPLNTLASYPATKAFAHKLAKELEQQYPHQVVSKMKKSLRTNKVFIDWSQNDERKTTVCVYSLRAMPRPLVSTPVTWDEVETAVKTSDASTLQFDYRQVLERIEQHGDLFSSVLTLKQALPPASG